MTPTPPFGAGLGLGPKSTAMLARAGIEDRAALEALGAPAAWLQVRAVCPGASLNLLWALEGVLCGMPWQWVAAHQRDRLLAEVAALQAAP